VHGRGGQNNEAMKYIESQKPQKEKKKQIGKRGVKDSNKVDKEKEERRHKTEGGGLQK
jgi:hypothetical protein